MNNLSIKVNLANLKCVVKPLTGKSGAVQDCLIIPIEANKLIRGKEGIFLDLIAFRLKEMRPDSPDTHCIKQSFSKEYMEALPESEKTALPFLGSLIDWDKSTKVNTYADLSTPIPEEEIKGDLPF
jgi:hypothetical protein